MKYTRVDITGIPYKHPLKKWCRDTFGNPLGPNRVLQWNEMIWYSDTKYNNKNQVECHRFYFRNPEHATFFSLKWL